jgi:phage shock protein C
MKRLYRSQTDKKIAGIFGGIAEQYDFDPSILRLIMVFVGLATCIAPLLITYIIGWVIIPKGPVTAAQSSSWAQPQTHS